MASVGGYDLITWTVVAAFAIANLAVLTAAGPRGASLRSAARRALRRLTGRDDLDWLDWVPVWVGMLVAFGAVVAYGVLSGQYACSPASDGWGLVASGRAFWSGGNPFTASVCGGVHEIPYGFAAVLIDALGSLGGIVGIYAIWGAIAFLVVPLAWRAAGDDRRWVLLYLASSVLLLPLVALQIDGATNAIVPVTVLVALELSRRRERWAAVVGGFLATARFPTAFAQLGLTGSNRRGRAVGFALVAATFVGITALSYLRWGAEFLDPVFVNQISRRSFSLNFYGVLLLANALPTLGVIADVQAVLTLALVLAVFARVRSPILAAALVLTGIALLTPFLSFSILVWLLPVALVGARARWWLWGIGVVGAVNYEVAYLVWAQVDGIPWPSDALDLVLTALLVGLFVELWRAAGRSARAAASGASAPAPSSPG